MVNSENCETSYEEIQRMRRAKKRAEFKAQAKHYAKLAFIIALPFIIIGLLIGLIGYKDSTEVIVKQSPFGAMSCVEGQGFYLKNFSKTYAFQKATSFYFNSSNEKVKGKGWEGGDDDEDDIEVTLQRNSKAWISGYLMFELPTDCNQLIKLRNKHHDDFMVKHDLVRNAVMSGILKTAPMFTAEAAKVTNLAELQALAYDQITKGEYLTVTRTEKEEVSGEERDSTGKVLKKAEYAEYKVTSLKTDSNGNRIIVSPSTLNEFGVKITQFQIRGVRLDSVSQNQLDVVKKRETQRVANITEAETAKQAAITNEANGRANAAKAKWDAEAVKARVIVQEMADGMALKLVDRHLVTDQLVLTVNYDRENLTTSGIRDNYNGEVTTDHYGRQVPKHGHGTTRMEQPTSSSADITDAFLVLYDRIVNPMLLIRRLTLTVNNVVRENDTTAVHEPVQLDLFTDYAAEDKKQKEITKRQKKERRIQEARLKIKRRFGKNAILKGLNFEEGATARERNAQIGGHKA